MSISKVVEEPNIASDTRKCWLNFYIFGYDYLKEVLSDLDGIGFSSNWISIGDISG